MNIFTTKCTTLTPSAQKTGLILLDPIYMNVKIYFWLLGHFERLGEFGWYIKSVKFLCPFM